MVEDKIESLKLYADTLLVFNMSLQAAYALHTLHHCFSLYLSFCPAVVAYRREDLFICKQLQEGNNKAEYGKLQISLKNINSQLGGC